MYKMPLAVASAAIVGFFAVFAAMNPSLLSARTPDRVPPAVAATSAQPSPARVAVKDLKAGMVVNGATVLKTADLVVDWKKWLGHEVIIRGTAFGADDRHVAFTSANVLFSLSRMDSETRRWFLRECYGSFVNPDCNGLTIRVVPEDGRFSRELANAQVLR